MPAPANTVKANKVSRWPPKKERNVGHIRTHAHDPVARIRASAFCKGSKLIETKLLLPYVTRSYSACVLLFARHPPLTHFSCKSQSCRTKRKRGKLDKNNRYVDGTTLGGSASRKLMPNCYENENVVLGVIQSYEFLITVLSCFNFSLFL